jgi:hypothetical protein
MLLGLRATTCNSPQAQARQLDNRYNRPYHRGLRL